MKNRSAFMKLYIYGADFYSTLLPSVKAIPRLRNSKDTLP